MRKQFLLFLFLIPVFSCQDEKRGSPPGKDVATQDREAFVKFDAPGRAAWQASQQDE